MAVNNENERYLNIEVICPSESTKTFCKLMSNQSPGKVTITRKELLEFFNLKNGELELVNKVTGAREKPNMLSGEWKLAPEQSLYELIISRSMLNLLAHPIDALRASKSPDTCPDMPEEPVRVSTPLPQEVPKKCTQCSDSFHDLSDVTICKKCFQHYCVRCLAKHKCDPSSVTKKRRAAPPPDPTERHLQRRWVSANTQILENLFSPIAINVSAIQLSQEAKPLVSVGTHRDPEASGNEYCGICSLYVPKGNHKDFCAAAIVNRTKYASDCQFTCTKCGNRIKRGPQVHCMCCTQQYFCIQCQLAGKHPFEHDFWLTSDYT